MRIIVKFTATLLVGVCCIIAGSGVYSWNREMSFFENDMGLDHRVLGEAVAATIRKTWADGGKQEGMLVPPAIDQAGRHLSLRLLDLSAGADVALRDLPANARESLEAGKPTSFRDTLFQSSYVPINGAAGERAILEIREPLEEELKFSQASMLQSVVAALAVTALCTVLTFVLGLAWIGRPIQILCQGARRIGAGDLSGGMKVSGNNELSMLADEMNAMCRALAQALATIKEEGDRRMATLEQLRHADRLATIGKLAAGIAHELGTPLNVVWAHANMVVRGEVAGAEVTESAQVIAGQSEQMTTIIRQLLEFARPRSAVKAPTDLVQLARSTLSFLESTAQKCSVQLAFVGRADSVITAVDPAQLQQVLTNLVVNAIQATAAGGKVEIDVVDKLAPPPPDRVGVEILWHCIQVRDTGAGISPEHMHRLFEPFFTTKSVGEGTGLGLSVACGIVQENGGWIAVDSQLGKGSCFSVFLPQQAVS